MACELLDLLGLLVDDVGGVCEVVVDKLLVGLIDKWTKEENGGRNEGETPEWDDLDEIVGEECTEESLEQSAKPKIGISKTYSAGSKYILCEDNSLRLDNEEVDKLMNITDEGVKGLLGYCVVFSWANLRSEPVREQSLSSSLRKNSDTQCHPCEFERVS